MQIISYPLLRFESQIKRQLSTLTSSFFEFEFRGDVNEKSFLRRRKGNEKRSQFHDKLRGFMLSHYEWKLGFHLIYIEKFRLSQLL